MNKIMFSIDQNYFSSTWMKTMYTHQLYKFNIACVKTNVED